MLEWTFHDRCIELFHSGSKKRRHETNTLIKHDTETPYVRFYVVGLVVPNLRTRIVWCSRLSIQHSSFSLFRHVKVSQFDVSVFAHKDIGSFYIPMQNVYAMESSKTLYDLYEKASYEFFREKLTRVFTCFYFHKQVTVVGILHHDI